MGHNQIKTSQLWWVLEWLAYLWRWFRHERSNFCYHEQLPLPDYLNPLNFSIERSVSALRRVGVDQNAALLLYNGAMSRFHRDWVLWYDARREEQIDVNEVITRTFDSKEFIGWGGRRFDALQRILVAVAEGKISLDDLR